MSHVVGMVKKGEWEGGSILSVVFSAQSGVFKSRLPVYMCVQNIQKLFSSKYHCSDACFTRRPAILGWRKGRRHTHSHSIYRGDKSFCVTDFFLGLHSNNNNNIYFLDTRSSPDDIIHENCWDTILQVSSVSSEGLQWNPPVGFQMLSLLISSLYEPQNYSSLEIGPQVSVESVLSTDALPWQLRNKILFNQSRPILGGAVYLELSFLSCSSSIPKRSPDVPHLYDAFCFTKWLVYASYYLLWKYWMLE